MLRNKEIQCFLEIFLGWAVLCLFAAFIFREYAVILVGITIFGCGSIFFIFTNLRYRRLSELAEEIDLVLHHSDKIYISNEEEGELAILENEIAKMTLRIREQNAALKKEKIHLANSLADIAHQLRTPLTSAELILDRLKESTDDKNRQHLFQEMTVLHHHMDHLLTVLLKISRLDADIITFEKKRVSVSDLITNACRPFAISLELHNINLQIKVPFDATIIVDPMWMAEALQNLIKNAIESIGDQGTILICAENTPLYSQIIICDDGPGFPNDMLPHLFERFYRGKGAHSSGYGIGLALSKNIIMHLDGTIQAKNRSEGGAMFIIRFPK